MNTNNKRTPASERKSLPWKTAIVVIVLLVGVACYGINYVRKARAAATVVVVRVNGEPIYEGDLERGLSSDSFNSTMEDMKQNKLNRLISQVAIRQFLSEHGVKTSKEPVDKEILRLEDNPPSMGCPCCTYPDLSAYLATIGYTRDNLRADISNDIGITEYAKRSWEKSHPSQKDVLKEIGGESKFIRARYVNAWQIFFNTFQQSGYGSDPDEINRTASLRANKAWDRLQKGESFAAVAKSASEDMTSKQNGGALGFVDRSSYGEEFGAMVYQLKPGQVSKPFQSSWGYHIIKWSPMTDEDVVAFCESYFVQKECDKLREQIMKGTRIDKPNEWPTAPTTPTEVAK